MTDHRSLIHELKEEAATTRRVLERIPEDKLSWKPHPKSMSAGQLGLHIARLPQGITNLVSELEVELPIVPLPEAESVDQMLHVLTENVRYASNRIAEWGDDGLRADWKMTSGGQTVLAMPRGVMLRKILLNHSYHHRGQLTVYLRLLGVALPPVYGPTADESMFAAA